MPICTIFAKHSPTPPRYLEIRFANNDILAARVATRNIAGPVKGKELHCQKENVQRFDYTLQSATRSDWILDTYLIVLLLYYVNFFTYFLYELYLL